jgi:hypothetical protein
MRKKRQRQRLADDQNNKCFWCKREMTAPTPRGVKSKSTDLTLDHVYNKLHPDRKDKAFIKVAACFRCNKNRGREFFNTGENRPEFAWPRPAEFTLGDLYRQNFGKRRLDGETAD